MNPDQLNQLFNVVVVALPVLWRIFFSSRKNTQKATEVRLTNGHANNKRDTDEIRMFRERELMADRALNDDLTDLKRWRTTHQQQYFESQLQALAHQRATEESIRHLEELTKLLIVQYKQLQDCCDDSKRTSQETAQVKHVAILPDISAASELPKASGL